MRWWRRRQWRHRRQHYDGQHHHDDQFEFKLKLQFIIGGDCRREPWYMPQLFDGGGTNYCATAGMD
jgi:hypothetical protein